MAAERIADEAAITQSLLSRDSANTDQNHALAAENESKDGLATAVLIFSTVVAILGSFVFGTTVGFSSPAQSGIIDDLGLTVAQYSVCGSILTIGAMIGAAMSGKIADYIGRRATMGVAELICIAGWLAIIFAKKAWLLDIGRFATGYASGMLSFVVPVYIAEITPKNLRGAFTALNQLLITTGVSAMYVIGNFIAWRILATIGSIACFLHLLGLFFIPESPRWLAKIDRWKDSHISLQRLRGKYANTSQEAAEIRDYTEAINKLSKCTIIDLFDRKYAHSLIVGIGLAVLQQFVGINAIVFYASSIFESAGFSSKIGTIAIVLIQIPMNILGTILLDSVGRRPLLLVSSIGTCFGTFLIGLSFLLQALDVWNSSSFLALIGVVVYMGFFALGMAGIPWIMMSEIFPINVKGLAGSLVTAIVWLCSWIISFSYNFSTEWITTEGTFFCFSIIAGLTPIFVVKLVPETKGRTLEEIQASMKCQFWSTCLENYESKVE